MRTLATLAEVKDWLGLNTDTNDALLTRLLEGATQSIYSYLSIDTFGKVTYNETYDGYGQTWMVLRQSPIIAVLAVSANGQPFVPAQGDGVSSPYVGGFVLLNRQLHLFGHCFPRQRASVFVRYDAGYYISDEARTVPASPGAYTIQASYHWLENGQVTLTNGTPLTEVASTPGDGEYTVADGLYTFNAAQAEEAVLISYSYVPADVVDAVINIVGERFKYMDRIGYSSKSLGGQETVSFAPNKFPEYVLQLLNKYKRVAPIA